MAVSKGKDFESLVKECASRLPDAYVLRLYDTMNGYQRITNPCDFIIVRNGKTYMTECKSIKGNTFNLVGLTQYDKLKTARDLQVKGLYQCVLLWYIDHKQTFFIPLDYITWLKDNEAKSINIKYLLDDDAINFGVKLIPGQSKRVFTNYDFDTIF